MQLEAYVEHTFETDDWGKVRASVNVDGKVAIAAEKGDTGAMEIVLRMTVDDFENLAGAVRRGRAILETAKEAAAA